LLCPFSESGISLAGIFTTPWNRLTLDALFSWEFGEDSL